MIWRWESVAGWLKGPTIGAEVGVKEGRFLSYMLQTFPYLMMYAIDPWEQQPGNNETYEGWDFNTIYQEYLDKTLAYKDRVIELRMYSVEAAQTIPDKFLDFVFIDAQHDYKSVKYDIEIWTPKVKEGGLITGHDFSEKFPGVIQAVKESGPYFTGDNDTWGRVC